MFEDAFGRLVNGALWGLGAGLLVTFTRGGGDGLRSVTKGVLRGYLVVADRVQEATAELREGLDDLAAEVRAERANQAETSAAKPR